MRTTLDIDDDILAAAKELAKADGKTMGAVISDLARAALTRPSPSGFAEAPMRFDTGDFPTLPRRGGPPVTLELVRQTQDEIDLEDSIPWDHTLDRPRVFDEQTNGAQKKTKAAPKKKAR